jgi:transcriptional regulator with GAF, ATPase, and Fis domain
MVYRYRLAGRDTDWQNTRDARVEYQDLPTGSYTFEVVAVDRDLTYSQPASLELEVAPDPRVQALTEALSGSGALGDLIGESQALRRVETQLIEVAQTEMTVLVLGETGTGKGLAGRAVHALSRRRAGPFVQVNCGAIPDGLVESELFGHERGAFTGATSRKLGKVEIAEGGTLLLDEIGDLAQEAQVKLLRVLQEQTFERVGGTETLSADVRVIAVTNRDLPEMVSGGTFRADLYYRLQAFPVRMPPLRERREDVPLLAAYFVTRMAAHLDKQVCGLAPGALDLLATYDWPGNVRELEHAMQRAVVVCRGAEIRAQDIGLGFGGQSAGPTEEILSLEEYERRYIRQVLAGTGWVIGGGSGAAAMLGLKPSTLRSRMKRLGIRRE